jgi:eukaryotic-like serine/threonine-protein kinase
MDRASNEPRVVRYRFGNVEFDPSRLELRVSGVVADVQRKPLEILALLLNRADTIVTKEELLDTIWCGRPTVDNVLANAIAKLRIALGEEDAKCIITQPRVGYRFSGALDRKMGRDIQPTTLTVGEPMPGRDHFALHRMLARTSACEVWLAKHAKAQEQRVFKCTWDESGLRSLKREAVLFRLLRASLGERDDIVRIMDWNFVTSPYFLEYEFAGQHLGEWATANLAPLTRDARIAVFLQLADTVAAIHSAGVLHKDLKPANILVADRSGHPHVRVSDFGVGVTLAPERLAALGITQFGLSASDPTLVSSDSGTPFYIAPELIAGRAASEQSDLYALGIILYQLLVGDLSKPMVAGWERNIDDPLLIEDIGGATDGDPTQRLRSVTQLTERLRNLASRRFNSQQQQAAEQAARDAQETLQRMRNRRPWMIAACLMAVLGLAGILYSANRSRLALEQVAHDRLVTERISVLTRNVLQAVDPMPGSNNTIVSMVDLLNRAVESVRVDLRDQPGPRAQLLETIGTSYRRLGRSDAASVCLKEALQIRRELNTEPLKLGSTLIELAMALRLSGQVDDAERIVQEVQTLVRQHHAERSELNARTQAEQGNLALLRSKPTDAEHLVSAALKLGREMAGPRSPLVAATLVDLAVIHYWNDDNSKAESALRAAIDIYGAIVGTLHPDRVNAEYELGLVLKYQGRVEAAAMVLEASLASTEKIYGASSFEVANVASALSEVRAAQRRWPEAEKLVRRALGAYNQTNDPAPMSVGQAQTLLTLILINQQKFSEAEQAARRALSSLASLEPDHQYRASAEHQLGEALLATGRLTEAETVLRNAADRWQRAGAPAWRRARSLIALGEVRYKQGRIAEAESLYTANYPVLADTRSADPDSVERARDRLKHFYAQHGDTKKLMELLARTRKS